MAGCDVELKAKCVEGDANLSQPFEKKMFLLLLFIRDSSPVFFFPPTGLTERLPVAALASWE